MQDTLLISRLPAFEAKLRVRERRRPKLYWIDPGLVRAIKRQMGPVTAEERGSLLEGWVFGQIRAHAEQQRLYDNIAYWAPVQSHTEVDFLLTRDHAHLAIEVKAASKYNRTMLKGLRAIAPLEGVVRRILVYRGRRSFRTEDGIAVWPVDTFNRVLGEGRLWP